MLVYVLFYLGQLSHFPSCCGAGVINLNVPPSSCLLPSRRCGLGAGSIPLRAIVNKKQCETRGCLCRWSSTTEQEMYKTPRVFLFPKTQTITSKGTIWPYCAVWFKVPLNSNQSINPPDTILVQEMKKTYSMAPVPTQSLKTVAHLGFQSIFRLFSSPPSFPLRSMSLTAFLQCGNRIWCI